MNSPASMNLLPNEILHKVFSCLSVSERLDASLVCKKWHETLNSRSLLKDIVVHINDNCLISLFLSRSRKFLNFKFKFVIMDDSYCKLFESFSSHIEYLCFESCEMRQREPFNFHHLTFDNLKVLKIIHCDLWTLLPSLPNLKELYLLGNCPIADDEFSKLQKTMKHLQTFSLLCTISCERTVLKRFYPGEMKYESNPSPYILSITAVCSFISERALTLKELHVFPTLTPSALREISSLKDLKLHKIDLSNCFNCANGLIDLFRNQPTLKVIILNGVFGINDDIIEALCSLLPDAEEVSIHGNVITNRSLNKLFQLTKLHNLDIGGGQILSAQAFNEAILNFKAVQLRLFILDQKLKEAESIAFDALFRKCKNLRFLDISSNKIPDTVMYTISENLTQLEYLFLHHSDISDRGLAGTHTCLSNLKKLKILDLSECTKITENTLISAIKFSYLKYLYLRGCNLKESTIQLLRQQNPCIKQIFWDKNYS